MPPQEQNISPSYLVSQNAVWIFGYGSLIWKTAFEFSEKKVGYVEGFVRRFWQGCISHRGVAGSPGRVATLIEEDEGITWGVAFKVKGHEQIFKALQHLNVRESVLGGYDLQTLQFHTQDGLSLTVLTYIATPCNRNYLGPGSTEEIARDIATSSGKAGTNTEYLFRLVEFMNEELPDVADSHLQELDLKTKELVKCNSIQSNNTSAVVLM